jgi:hypothetical protein
VEHAATPTNGCCCRLVTCAVLLLLTVARNATRDTCLVRTHYLHLLAVPSRRGRFTPLVSWIRASGGTSPRGAPGISIVVSRCGIRWKMAIRPIRPVCASASVDLLEGGGRGPHGRDREGRRRTKSACRIYAHHRACVLGSARS